MATDPLSAVLVIQQDNQQITNPAVVPGAIQAESGIPILSEVGGTISPESSSDTTTTTTTPSGTGLGSQSDFVNRLAAALPIGWFPNIADAPVLNGLLSGIASIWTSLWSLLSYVNTQKRISTATDINLDIISADFLGDQLPRNAGESDASFRARIKASIFQPMVTRAAVSAALTTVTGAAPKIFEPRNPADTGGWGASGSTAPTGVAYGACGGYGSYQLPFQFFVQTQLPATASLPPAVQGYGTRIGAPGAVIGGYGSGAIEYEDQAQTFLAIEDGEVLAVLNRVKPAATVAWVSTLASNPQTSKSSSGSGTQAPSAPANLTVTAATPTSSTVVWSAATGTQPISYTLEYRPTGTQTWQQADAPTSGLSDIVTGLQDGRLYDYQVVATNSAGSSTSDTLTMAAGTTAPPSTLQPDLAELSNPVQHNQVVTAAGIAAQPQTGPIVASLGSGTITEQGQVVSAGGVVATAATAITASLGSGQIAQGNQALSAAGVAAAARSPVTAALGSGSVAQANQIPSAAASVTQPPQPITGSLGSGSMTQGNQVPSAAGVVSSPPLSITGSLGSGSVTEQSQTLSSAATNSGGGPGSTTISGQLGGGSVTQGNQTVSAAAVASTAPATVSGALGSGSMAQAGQTISAAAASTPLPAISGALGSGAMAQAGQTISGAAAIVPPITGSLGSGSMAQPSQGISAAGVAVTPPPSQIVASLGGGSLSQAQEIVSAGGTAAQLPGPIQASLGSGNVTQDNETPSAAGTVATPVTSQPTLDNNFILDTSRLG